jgi:hypothetical protein
MENRPEYFSVTGCCRCPGFGDLIRSGKSTFSGGIHDQYGNEGLAVEA